ncbi:MAG: ATP-binding protein [Desulfarculus sp.]|nr:ATP-binding protein [Desulfarculus sp.]
MIIAVASGKGGTGKTTVSASLAQVWGAPVVAVDLDVEEPNLHLFLRPEITSTSRAWLEVPRVVEGACTACGACSELCQFKAISLLGDVLLTFPEMCHGCGGCLAVCPSGALTPDQRELGEILWGRAEGVGFLSGRLRVGEAMSPPLMRQVRQALAGLLAGGGRDAIIDAPPGVSCPAVNAVMDADVILLVTEPTPFGLHDLGLAREAFSPLGKPLAVVINRAGLGDDRVREFCRREGLPILAEIPFARQAAEAYARGQVLACASDDYRGLFAKLAQDLRHLAARGPASERMAAHA